MNIYDLIKRAQELRDTTQMDSVSPELVGKLHEDTLKYINEYQLLASSPAMHKTYASVSAMQGDASPKSDLTGRALLKGQLVIIVPASSTDATAGDVFRYNGPSGNTSGWTYVAKIGGVPADAELSASSTNPLQNKVVTEKLTELSAETNTKLTELSVKSEGNFFKLIGKAEIDVPASSNGWHYYKIPRLKNGEKYTFTLNLAEAAASAVYWNIRVDGAGTLFTNNLISVGSLESKLEKEINQEFTTFELGLYSNGNIPAVSFALDTSKTILTELRSDLQSELQGGIQDAKNKADSAYELAQENSASINDKFFELVGKAEVNVPASSNGWHYYKIPRLKKGETYTFTLNLAEAAASVMYWTIRVDGAGTLFANNVVNAGTMQAVVTRDITSDYDLFELGVYSGANIPAISFVISTSKSSSPDILPELQTDIQDAKNKANSAYELAQENEDVIKNIFDRPVGVLYKDAWVRYSDGLISDSTGGAKVYIIMREDIAVATKIYARVCTQHKDFAAIAFYSDEKPSMASYIKAASVEGKSSNELNDFEAIIPANCRSILVLNMSQLQTDYDIRVNESMFVSRNEEAAIVSDARPLFNPFMVKNQYYHFNQETSGADTYIPAQSLFDIDLAARLGFEMIEVNAHPCKDGVLICKHGSGGKFGDGLKSNNGVNYSAVAINSVTSIEVREHITYDSRIAKYCVPIPTLDEFCKECKKHNLSIKANYVSGLLPVLRKYFTDDKIFISGLQQRGDFRGLVEVVYYPSNGLEDLDAKCLKVGYPIQIIIASGQFEVMSDDEVKEVVDYAHQHSYTVAVPYLSSMNWMRAQSLGVDVNLSCERTINALEIGNDKNITSLNDSAILLHNGASYDEDGDVLRMPTGAYLEIPADNIMNGAIGVDMCYEGTITMHIGHDVSTHSFIDMTGDGISTLSISQAILPKGSASKTTYYIRIYAESGVVIKSMNARCSKL